MLKNCVTSGTCSSSLQASGERSCLSNVGLLFKGNTTVGTLTLAQLTAWTSYLLIKTEFKTEMHEILHSVVICACLCCVFVSFVPLQKLPRVWVRKAFCRANITTAIPTSSQRCRISSASLKFCVLISFVLS